jgi:hypothetical protein
MADEFDEYEALEAEAEALSQPQQAQTVKAQAPAMIPIEQRGKGRPPVPKPQPKAPVQEETQVPEKKQPRYIIQHQPEVLALVDTLTEEVTPIKVADYTIKDDGMYLLLAKLLNDQDTVITGAGYQ